MSSSWKILSLQPCKLSLLQMVYNSEQLNSEQLKMYDERSACSFGNSSVSDRINLKMKPGLGCYLMQIFERGVALLPDTTAIDCLVWCNSKFVSFSEILLCSNAVRQFVLSDDSTEKQNKQKIVLLHKHVPVSSSTVLESDFASPSLKC